MVGWVCVCAAGHDSVWQVAYFAEGGGKFVVEFVSVPAYGGLPGPFWGAGLLMAVSLTYTLVPHPCMHSRFTAPGQRLLQHCDCGRVPEPVYVCGVCVCGGAGLARAAATHIQRVRAGDQRQLHGRLRVLLRRGIHVLCRWR